MTETRFAYESRVQTLERTFMSGPSIAYTMTQFSEDICITSELSAIVVSSGERRRW